MAPHSSTLVWEIPWTEEPGRLQSMGSLRVGHNWATSLSLFTFMHWRRKWQPMPVFLPGESQGRGSLVGCRLWGRTESDTTNATQQQVSISRASCWRRIASRCLLFGESRQLCDWVQALFFLLRIAPSHVWKVSGTQVLLLGEHSLETN